MRTLHGHALRKRKAVYHARVKAVKLRSLYSIFSDACVLGSTLVVVHRAAMRYLRQLIPRGQAVRRDLELTFGSRATLPPLRRIQEQRHTGGKGRSQISQRGARP